MPACAIIFVEMKNNHIMKSASIIFISAWLISGCVTSKDTCRLPADQTVVYPIGENGKWGFADNKGQMVIAPEYDSVAFFYQGIALVKKDGKFGYLRNDGKWHIKPKYSDATSFISNCALVSDQEGTFYINKQGEKINASRCAPAAGGGCTVVTPANPFKYFFKINGKYETAYKYYLVHPSGKTEEISDTTNLGLDIVREFSNQHILIGKDNKYGLYDIRPETKIVLTPQAHNDYRALAQAAFLKTIQTKYDEVRFEKQAGREVNYAAVRVKDKWGVIDSWGNEVLDTQYERLAIEPGWQMALIEFEPNRLGYKHFNGAEYFKRKK